MARDETERAERLASWNQRHADASTDPPEACYLVAQYLGRLPRTGRAVDIACGRGGNSLALARAGLETFAWDYSPVALDFLRQQAAAQNLRIHCQLVDLEHPDALSCPAFDVVVVSHYLHRPLLSRLQEMLLPGGWLLYQGYLSTPRPLSGPGDPRFRLMPGELPRLLDKVQLLYYEEIGPDHASGLTNMVLFVARGGR